MNLDGLVAALKIDEGFRPTVYDDSTGHLIVAGDQLVGAPTIGYGWNVSANPMTEAQASDRLRFDAIRAMKDASNLVPSWLALDDVRQNVLSNMSYNLGMSGLAKFKRLLSAVDARDFRGAAEEMRSSAWYRQIGKRAERLANEMETGQAS